MYKPCTLRYTKYLHNIGIRGFGRIADNSSFLEVSAFENNANKFVVTFILCYFLHGMQIQIFEHVALIVFDGN